MVNSTKYSIYSNPLVKLTRQAAEAINPTPHWRYAGSANDEFSGSPHCPLELRAISV